jgi:Type VI secretion system/phage-baseplate injector OB domain
VTQQVSNDLAERYTGSQWAVVSDVADPKGLKRIKVLLYHMDTETDWMPRLLTHRGLDAPLPQVGDTVAVQFHNGDPHLGFYTGVMTNLDNPGLGPSINDWALKIAGLIKLFVGTAVLTYQQSSANTFGTLTLGDVAFTKTGSTLDITGVSDISVNGVRVAKIGGTDSRGDTTIS